MKKYLKMFKDTKWWMYLPFTVFWMSYWIFEEDDQVKRMWRALFQEFNLMLITFPTLIFIVFILNHFLHFIN